MATRPTSGPDFGRTATDYARHRAGFPESIYPRLLAYGVGKAGQTLVDLGTGTGTLARGFARRGCDVVGIDASSAMLEQARRLAEEEGICVEYRVATAESTGLDAASADVVIAGQCWHWFERSSAARETLRVLRPGGLMVIAHFDWLPLPGNVVAGTEELIARHNPEWKGGGGMGMYPWWLRDLGKAGYRAIETFSYDEDVPYTHEAWRGRVRASAGVGAALGAAEVDAFDHDLAELLSERFSVEPVPTPHRVFAVVARAPH